MEPAYQNIGASMSDPSSPNEQDQLCLKITGRRFGQGGMAALRAYPSVLSVWRIDADDGDCLMVCLQTSINTTLLTHTVTNAGGQVESIEQVDMLSDDSSPSS